MSRSVTPLALLAALAAACTTDASFTPSDARSAPDHGASHSRDPDRTPQLNRQLTELRRATAHFQNFAKAADAGYAYQITPCWEHRTQGAMGYHYGKMLPEDWDLAVELLEPTLLMYEPGPAGQMRLVGME